MHDETVPLWQGIPPRPCVEQPFIAKPGVAEEVLDCNEPIDFFYLIFT